MSFIKKVFGLEEEFEEEYYEEEAIPEKKQEAEPVPTRANRAQKPNVVSIQSAPSKQSGAKVLLIEPRAYSEVQQIADHLLNKKAVVINLQQVEYDQAKRIVDFLSGTTYAVGGDIRRIGSSTFLCTSDNVDVSGQISDLHIDYNNDTRGW